LSWQHMKYKYDSSFPYLEFHKSFRNEEGSNAQVRIYTHWAIREIHLRNLVLVCKIQKKTSRWIVEQRRGKSCSINCSNSQQLKTRRS
jgi:hypothetical protein